MWPGPLRSLFKFWAMKNYPGEPEWLFDLLMMILCDTHKPFKTKGWKWWWTSSITIQRSPKYIHKLQQREPEHPLVFSVSRLLYFQFFCDFLYRNDFEINKFRFTDFTIISKHHKSNMGKNWYGDNTRRVQHKGSFMSLYLCCKVF